uniref:Uncharacterized protein n=1 Tax=Anguilla anguilla TaxID=7936 RepID=A0A0E9VP00_ANGAN
MSKFPKCLFFLYAAVDGNSDSED